MKGINKFKAARYCVLFLALLLVACAREQQTPPGILSKTDVARVLAEVYVTEEKVSRLSLEYDSASEVFFLMRDNISRKTGVPDSLFRKSLKYYSQHPRDIQEIYAIVVDSLQLREQRRTSQAGAKE